MADEAIEDILEAGGNVQDATLSPAIVGSEKSTQGGLGSLLYNVHSKYYTSIFGSKEETDLKFYEHAVVTTRTTQMCCLPKSYEITVIPRFKIVDASITLGPRSIPRLLTFLIVVVAAVLISVGSMNGGCGEDCSFGHCYDSGSGPCACVVIGSLMLSILIPLIILIPWLLKWQYIYFDVRKPATATHFFNRSGVVTYAYRLKKTAGAVASDVVFFDQNFVLNYAYGALSLGGNQTTNEAHILSHFNNANLATPIMPIYADKTVGEFVVPKLLQRKPHKGDLNFVDHAPATPPLTPVAPSPATFKDDRYN